MSKYTFFLLVLINSKAKFCEVYKNMAREEIEPYFKNKDKIEANNDRITIGFVHDNNTMFDVSSLKRRVAYGHTYLDSEIISIINPVEAEIPKTVLTLNDFKTFLINRSGGKKDNQRSLTTKITTKLIPKSTSKLGTINKITKSVNKKFVTTTRRTPKVIKKVMASFSVNSKTNKPNNIINDSIKNGDQNKETKINGNKHASYYQITLNKKYITTIAPVKKVLRNNGPNNGADYERKKIYKKEALNKLIIKNNSKTEKAIATANTEATISTNTLRNLQRELSNVKSERKKGNTTYTTKVNELTIKLISEIEKPIITSKINVESKLSKNKSNTNNNIQRTLTNQLTVQFINKLKYSRTTPKFILKSTIPQLAIKLENSETENTLITSKINLKPKLAQNETNNNNHILTRLDKENIVLTTTEFDENRTAAKQATSNKRNIQSIIKSDYSNTENILKTTKIDVTSIKTQKNTKFKETVESKVYVKPTQTLNVTEFDKILETTTKVVNNESLYSYEYYEDETTAIPVTTTKKTKKKMKPSRPLVFIGPQDQNY